MPPLSPSLQKALEAGVLIVAPTALAAGSLRAGYDRRQRAAGRTVWQPANILSWQQWLGSLWTGLVLSGQETRLLLNPAQEELLWRDIIAGSLDPANLTSAPAFAQLARSAYALAAGYNVTARLAAEAHTDDTEQFARWAADFTRLCGRHAYLPAARLPAALREHLGTQAFAAPAELHLTQFLDLPPADADLLEAFRAAGTRIVDHPRPTLVPITRLSLRAPNETEELRAIAHWLRTFLEDQPQASTPADLPTINVVLAVPRPDLALLDSIFREVLAPELDHITADPASAPWEFANGRALAELPIAATLLRLLRGLIRPLPLDQVTALLLSPYLGSSMGSAHDRNAAAQLDAWSLRDRPPLRPEVTYRELQRLAERSPFGESTLPWLRVVAAIEKAAELSAPRTHAAWTAFIRDLAAETGWPGQQPLTPLEFAATRAWDHMLDSIATLDFTGRRVPFAEALAALDHQAQTAAVPLPTHAPIRILSAAEAAALPCDALVLAQATDTNWPPAARPHPLLPWHLQASVGMPGAHPARDAARADRLSAVLLAAPHLLLSYAAEANEAPQRLAPSLAQLAKDAAWQDPVLQDSALKGRGFSPAISPQDSQAASAAEGSATSTNLTWRSISATDLIPAPNPPIIPEQIIDDIPLPPLPSPHVAGGTTVLQLQAACGFRAFAELRLRSTEPHAPELGFDARRAGSLLHQALDTFWQRVHSQAELRALTDAQLDEHLAAAVQQAFTTVRLADDPWDRAYQALQMHRLFDLLKLWLSFETQRAPFTVLRREEKQQLTVGPLELQLRVDRIDQVDSMNSLDSEADGQGTVLIDYKTGYEASPSAWESDRPDQPQLPLYTLLPNTGTLHGLAFARVRAGQFTWAGIQTEPGLLPKAKVNPELDGLVAEWRRVLTHLAEQFAAGDLSVNPKAYPATCTYCGQRFLCRVDPNTLLAASQEEPALEEETSFG